MSSEPVSVTPPDPSARKHVSPSTDESQAVAGRTAPPPLVNPEALARILQEIPAPASAPGRAPGEMLVADGGYEFLNANGRKTEHDYWKTVAAQRDFDPPGPAGPVDLTLYRDLRDSDNNTYRLHIQAEWVLDFRPRHGDDDWVQQRASEYATYFPGVINRAFDGLRLHLGDGAVVEIDVDIGLEHAQEVGSWWDVGLSNWITSWGKDEWITVNKRMRDEPSSPGDDLGELYSNDMYFGAPGLILPSKEVLRDDPVGAEYVVAHEMLGLDRLGYTQLIGHARRIDEQARQVQGSDERGDIELREMPQQLREQLSPFLDWIEDERPEELPPLEKGLVI